MNPAQNLFITHLQSGAYEVGAAKGMWGNADPTPNCPTWPFAFIWVAAGSKPGSPDRYTFRFDLTGYSASAPLALLWDMERNSRLAHEHWPKGKGHIPTIFNPAWRGQSLYAPCDRGAELGGHSNWAIEHRAYYWRPTFTIVKYLQFLYDILQSPEYLVP